MKNIVETFSRNEKGRDFVCSDLHGQYGLFIEQLQSVRFNSNLDRIFCVGDLIDRGPDNLECLRLIEEPWFFTLRGNHEELMLQGLFGDANAEAKWDQSGGSWHHKVLDVPEFWELVRLVERLPVAFQLENSLGQKVGVCHAQCPGSCWRGFLEDVARCDESVIVEAVWGRHKIKNWLDIRPVEKIDYVVSGHTIVPRAVRFCNQIWIDTGASMSLSPTILSIDALESLPDLLG